MLHYGDEVITEEALLAERDIVVVLAEPGAGKTELLRSLAERLAVEPCRASLFRHRNFRAPIQALVVDALDEVARIDQAAIDLVIEKARETQAAKIVFSSRSSEWDKARTQLVKESFAQEPAIVRLQPFTDAEQRLLFQSYLPGEDFSRFQEEAARFELIPLLGNPQFLKLFADAYVHGGRLLTSKTQIFIDAIKKLASELSTSTWQRDRPATRAIVALGDEIFAKLMLSGASGVSVADEKDVDFPYLHALSAADTIHLRSALNTRLFKPTSESSHHEPVHRIVAEYCAGRYLAERIGNPATGLSLRRLLSVIAPSGVVRDELRGLLGWMAALSNSIAQEVCIQTDPYAVLANGDPSQLAAPSKRLLLKHLKELSEIDPYFRRSDAWRRFGVAGFFTPDMVDEVRGLLVGDEVYPELRNLLLELLQGSDVVSSLVGPIQALVVKSDEDIYTRIRAQRLLAELAEYDHKSSIAALVANGDTASLRIALETVEGIGAEAVELPLLRDLFRQTCAKTHQRARIYDDDARLNLRYHTKRLISGLDLSSTIWLLDELTRDLACTCGKPRAYACECLPGPSKVIGSLLDRYFELAGSPHDPVKIWGWTRQLVFPDHRGPQDSGAVRALTNDDGLRQAIHRLAFSGQTGDRLWETQMGLSSGTGHAGLRMKHTDYYAISDHAFETGNVPLWKDFYARHNYYAEKKGPDPYRTHLRQQSRRNPRLLGAWSKFERDARAIAKRERVRWPRRNRRWQQKEEQDREARIKFYRENKTRIEAGAHWGAVRQIADYYLLKPEEMEELVDDPRTAELALRNCFAMLDPHLPTLADLVNKGHAVVRVLYAACLATYREEGNLDRIDGRILRAVKTDMGGYTGLTEEEARAFETEIDRRLFQSLADVEAYARDFIELQLLKSDDAPTDVGWLRYKEAFKPLQKTLALEWLARYRDMPYHARETLFDICAEHADRSELNELIEARCTEALRVSPSTPDGSPSAREFWLLRAFFFLPEPPAEVRAYLRGDPQTIFGIEYRAGRLFRDVAVGWPTLSADKVFEVLDAYVDAWPKVYLPSSYGTGSPPGETAYRFLKDIIYSIARDEPIRALSAVDKILAESRFSDFHADARSLKAGVLRKRALQGYRPPTPEAVVNLLDQNRIATVEDLRALLLDELAEYEIWLRNAETNPLDVFYPEGKRLGENDARNRVVEHLHGRMASRNLSMIIEHHMADANRCDITATAMIDGRRRLLVIEVKGQWHTELFSAASAQLRHRYSSHPDAAMQGVYLVLWFGGRETIAGRRNRSISTPNQLRDKIIEGMSAELHGSVDVFVLDLSRA
jgi:hypothetical protein